MSECVSDAVVGFWAGYRFFIHDRLAEPCRPMGEGLQAQPCRAGKVLVFQGRVWRPSPIAAPIIHDSKDLKGELNSLRTRLDDNYASNPIHTAPVFN